MIDLYTFNTPNGYKANIALEELGLDYELHWIDITEGDQHEAWYRQINPNEKIPAIVDRDGPDGEPLAIMESGAILLYLAEKTGKLLSTDPRLRSETIQWLFFQVGHIGPMMGQFGHFFHHPDDDGVHPYAIARYETETRRLLGVLEERLKKSEGDWLIGEYSIADIATAPWVDTLETFYDAGDRLELESYEHVEAWRQRFLERPAVKRGEAVLPKRLKEATSKDEYLHKAPKPRTRKNSSTRTRRSSKTGAAKQAQRG